MELSKLKELAAAAGVVGAGGAGFPTAEKLAAGADTLLINGAECEPLLYTDHALLKEQLATVLSGAAQIMEAAGIGQGHLCVKGHTAEKLGWQHGTVLQNGLSVFCLPDVYPMGDEVILTYQVLGRIVPPGSLPIHVGALVQNVETVYNIARAAEGVPVTEKWLTVAGKVPQPFVTAVPVGAPVAALLKAAGITVPADCAVIDGGPAMGKVIDPAEAVVKKTTKGICILPRSIPAVAGKLSLDRTVSVHASANCCQCTVCTDLCPRALIGYPLEPHRIVRSTLSAIEEEPAAFAAAQVCSGCGVCELTSCCQGISPRRVYARAKGILAKDQVRYSHRGELNPHPDRDYRMLPVTRFKLRIGVQPFDRPAEFRRLEVPGPLTLPTRQHVGAPAIPTVKAGDTVVAGACVAKAAEGVSAGVHAPVAGTVTAVNEDRVVIG